MDLSNWVFERFGREHYSPGLERMRFALGESIHNLNKLKIVTIAGTNGKGETALRLARNLNSHTFAVWTSPHVSCLTERFRNHEGLISKNELSVLLEETYELVLEKKYQLSFYEFLFLVFCQWVKDQDLEFLILEVGLGGEFDAVNVLDANLVLIPSISRDHQEFLGNRLDGILKEKLGVLRPGATLISFLDLNYLNQRIEKRVQAIGANWINLTSWANFMNFSHRNQLLSFIAMKILKNEEEVGRALEYFSTNDTFVENRGEILSKGADFHLYGSHNIDGMRKLIQFLHSGIYTFDTAIVSFSSRSRIDLVAMMKMLRTSSVSQRVVVTSFSHPKACEKGLLSELSLQEGLEFVEDISTHIESMLSGRVLVAGSYYFLSHIKQILGQ